MSRRDRWLLLMSILMFSGVGLYYLAPAWLGRSSQIKTVSQPVEAPKPDPAPAIRKEPGGTVSEAPSEPIDEKTPWGRNPFFTEAETGREKSPVDDRFQVRAIIMGPSKPVAAIDGRTVTVGEKVGDETVVEIRPNAVVLEKDGRKRILRISEPSITVEEKKGKK